MYDGSGGAANEIRDRLLEVKKESIAARNAATL